MFLNVDVVCSNLAIKNNMLYLSVHQLIKNEIECNTQMGKDLLLTKIYKPIFTQSEAMDEASEDKYCAVHFDQALVIKLVQQKIAENRTNQKFVLLEGLCNSNKFRGMNERLELRFMDEFFSIKQNIGEVSAVINLTSAEESTYFKIRDDQYEEPVIEDVKEEKKVEVDENGDPIEN